MSRQTIGLKLAENEEGWHRPWRRSFGASFVAQNNYGHEDWNFAVDHAIDGWVYGYAQGEPAFERRYKTSFDLLFYVYGSARGYRAVGLYLGAEFLEEDAREAVAASEGWAAVLERRERDIQRAFGRRDGKRVWSHYRETCAPFNWRVRVESVIELTDRPCFTPPYRATRDGTPYYFEGKTWGELLRTHPVGLAEADVTTVEGRIILTTHRMRERDPNRAARIKDARLRSDGRLTCAACDIDFGAIYGPAYADLLEAHHTAPLGGLRCAGEPVSDSDLVLLCPTCHRLSHRSGHFELLCLRAFLKEPLVP